MRSTALRRMVAAHLDTDIISHCRNLRHGSRPSTSSAHAGLALRPELTSARGFADLVKVCAAPAASVARYAHAHCTMRLAV